MDIKKRHDELVALLDKVRGQAAAKTAELEKLSRQAAALEGAISAYREVFEAKPDVPAEPPEPKKRKAACEI